MALFHIEDLTFTYPAAATPCLDSVNLSISQGEYVVLCGRSGSGKTTLLRHLKPVLMPHGTRVGKILLDTVPVDTLSPAQQAQRIGYVMQDPDEQLVTDKVWHELAFGLENLRYDQKTIATRVAEMASYFGISDWFYRDVATLSGGQKQLVNLASIMAMQPQVLILDEPTSQLDPIAAADFLNTVRKINIELGTTVLITEHRLEDILPYADRVIVMERGSVSADGTPRAVCSRLYAENSPMFAAMPTPAQVFYSTGAEGNCPLTVREGRRWLADSFPQGAQIPALPAKTESGGAHPTALSIKNLWFRYEKNGTDILRDVQLHIPQGTLFAILGSNGAGKSTLLRAISGICRPYRGSIQILGKKVSAYKGGSLFENCLAMLPQDPKSLFVKSTVLQELEEMQAAQAHISQVISLCGLEDLLDRHPYDLSGGEQQRVALGKVLLSSPKILLLDEPTKGLDCFFKEQLGKILLDLKAEGITILMVSHDVEFCAKNADLTGMFFDGKLLAADTPRQFFGSNSFYTTAANRMSRCVFQNAVTTADVVTLFRENQEARV